MTTTTITSGSNALDSIERMTAELDGADPADALRLKGAITWGWHAVGLMAYARLRPERRLFDAWLQEYLPEGEPPLEPERDARWEERERLSFLELLDMLSEEGLSILKPEFYQGWQDRTSRCHGLRRQTAEIVGGSIDDVQRQQLLLLLAAYHRLIRLPAGVTVDAAAIRLALPALLDLAQLLVDDTSAEAGVIAAALTRCRGALG